MPNRDSDAEFQAAVEATRATIWQDRDQAPEVLKELFTVIGERLSDPSLTATSAWQAAGIRGHSLWRAFRAVTELSVKGYIDARRSDLTDLLMATTRLDLYTISRRIGYTNYLTFVKCYRRQKNRLPADVPREHMRPFQIDDATSFRAGRGMLTEEAYLGYIEDLLQIYPAAAGRIHIRAVPDPEPLVIVDGARDDRLEAEDLWQKIRDLPFDEQGREVRGHLFRSQILFDLLRRKSRLEGRKNRQRGIEVAKLALISLEKGDEVFGERIYELRALGWAWLGNAHRLALDLLAAASAFKQADREWAAPRAKRDPTILASMCALKGSLLMVRREYVAAIQELDRSLAIFRQSGEAVAVARELITRATIHIYAGEPSAAVDDLREAAGLIDEDEEKELAFAICGNLANALARSDQTKDATKELQRARQLEQTIEDPLGTTILDCIEGDLKVLHGDIEGAKQIYQRARTGFCDAGERNHFGVVSVDLMVVHSMQDDWERVGTLATETLPILSSLTLHSETLAIINVLAQAVEAGSISSRLLKDLRAALLHDPLSAVCEPGELHLATRVNERRQPTADT